MVSKENKSKNKYELLVQPRLEEIEGWARNGVTDREMARVLGISEPTFYNYKKKYTELAEALGKRFVACREVENALYTKAVGRVVVLHKPLKIKKTIYSDTGRKLSEEERVEMVEEEIYYPPETSAIKFFLTNMEPEKWKNVREEDNVDSTVTVTFGGGSEEYGD